MRPVSVELVRRRYESLSFRERSVLDRIMDGLLNKQIAYELGISMRTVEVHRSRIMQRMEAPSFANLVIQVTTMNILSDDFASQAALGPGAVALVAKSKGISHTNWLVS